MRSIHWCFTAFRPVVSSCPLLSRLLTPTTVLRSSATVALTWTQRFTIALSSDSSLHGGRSCRLRGLSPASPGRESNRGVVAPEELQGGVPNGSDAWTQTGPVHERSV